MPHYVASDLGLHCLAMSNKKEARLIRVKMTSSTFIFVRQPFNVYNEEFVEESEQIVPGQISKQSWSSQMCPSDAGCSCV